MKKLFYAFTTVLLLGAGCVTAKTEITTFDQCAAAGNAVMESYPRQCRANGKTFVEVVAVPPTPPANGGGKEVAFQYGAAYKLGIGDTASFEDGLRVELKTINDSRCKPDVQCIWAGELGGTFSVKVGDGAAQELILGQTTKPSATMLGRAFKLGAVTESTVTLTVMK